MNRIRASLCLCRRDKRNHLFDLFVVWAYTIRKDLGDAENYFEVFRAG